MSSKPGDKLTKSRVLVFSIHTNFIRRKAEPGSQ